MMLTSFLISCVPTMFVISYGDALSYNKLSLRKNAVSLLQTLQVKSELHCAFLCDFNGLSCGGFNFLQSADGEERSCHLYRCVDSDGEVELTSIADALTIFVSSTERTVTNLALCEFSISIHIYMYKINTWV